MQRTLARRPQSEAAQAGPKPSARVAARIPSANSWGDAADLLPQALASPAVLGRRVGSTQAPQQPARTTASRSGAGHDFRRIARPAAPVTETARKPDDAPKTEAETAPKTEETTQEAQTEAETETAARSVSSYIVARAPGDAAPPPAAPPDAGGAPNGAGPNDANNGATPLTNNQNGSTTLPATVMTSYDVGGATLADVSQNLPADEAGNAGFVINVTGTTGDPITRAEAQVTHTIQLPHWTERDTKCDQVKQAWDSFLAALTAHENGHVALSRARLASVHSRFIGIPLTNLSSRIATETTAMQAAYDAYDAANGHGTTGNPPTILNTSVVCPPPAPTPTAPPTGGTPIAPKLERPQASRAARAEAEGVDVERGGDVSHIVRQGLSGGGQPLDSASRAFFEPRMGHDLSNIRIHTGAQASSSAEQVNARAYAVGGDIAFKSGEYNPGTSAGKHLLAHELTHTVQQGATAPLQASRTANDATIPSLRRSVSRARVVPLSPAPISLSRKIMHDTTRLPQTLAQVKESAQTAKAHAPVPEISQTAQNAAQEPPNAPASQANAQQAGSMSNAPKGQVQKNAFLELLRRKIAEVTPSNQDELKKFKQDGRAQRMGGELQQNVQQQSQQAQAQVANASNTAPPTPGPTRVPGAPPVAPPPPAMPTVPADKAAPPTPPSVAPDAQQAATDADKKMADAKITPEQLQKANDPRFTAVADSRKKMLDNAQTKPAEIDAAQQARAGQAVVQAQSKLQTAQSTMAGHHAAHHAKALTAAEIARQKAEAERKKVADEIEKRFTDTKTRVDAKLKDTNETAEKKFSDGKTAEFAHFEDSLNSRMIEYWFEHPIDATASLVAGLTDGQKAIFANERQIFTTRMDNLLVGIADYVEKSLTEAKDIAAKGKADMDAYVAGLPANLRQVGQEAETALGSRFEELSASVDSAREELASSLTEQYQQAQTEMDEREKQFEEEHKGLLSDFADKLDAVMKAIDEFKARLAGVVQDGEATIDLIIADPIEFLNHLLDSLKAGFGGFWGNIGTHLQKGLMEWVFGTLASGGIPMPASFDLKGFGMLALNVLDVSVDTVVAKLMTLVGPMTQKAAGAAGKVVGVGQQVMDIGAMVMPKIMEYVNTFKSGGVEGLWEQIKGDLTGLKDMILDGIKGWVIEKLIGIGIQKLMTMSNPAGAIVEAVLAIYKTVMFFIEKAQQVMSLVESVVRSVGNIARGNIGGAAAYIEQSMARAIPLVIGFIADLIGLGGLSNKVQEFVKKAKALVWRGIDAVLKKVAKIAEKIIKGAVKMAQKLATKAKNAFSGSKQGDKKPEPPGSKKSGKDDRTVEQKQADLNKALSEANALLGGAKATEESVRAKLPAIKAQYRLVSLELIVDNDSGSEETVHIHGAVNPEGDTPPAKLKVSDIKENDEFCMRIGTGVTSRYIGVKVSSVGKQGYFAMANLILMAVSKEGNSEPGAVKANKITDAINSGTGSFVRFDSKLLEENPIHITLARKGGWTTATTNQLAQWYPNFHTKNAKGESILAIINGMNMARRHIVPVDQIKNNYLGKLNNQPFAEGAKRMSHLPITPGSPLTNAVFQSAAQGNLDKFEQEPENIWIGDSKENSTIKAVLDKPQDADWSDVPGQLNAEFNAHVKAMKTKYEIP